MLEFQKYIINDVNTKKVFESILEYGPIMKKDIQGYTNLSWGGVYNSITKLLKSNSIIQFKESQNKSPGRIPTFFDINYKENLCVGVDVTLGRIIGVISYLNGKCIYSKTILMESNLSKDMINGLMNMLNDIFEFVDHPQYIKSIGLALPSSTIQSWNKGQLEHPFHGDFPKNLREIIKSKFGVMTEIFTDPDCLLASELNNMPIDDKKDDIMVLRWSYGIGLSMMIRGSIYHGSNSMAGEIGHTVVEPNGNICTCGKRGCLETYASVHAIISRIKKEGHLKKHKGINNNEINTFSDVLELYNENYQFIREIINDALEKMAIILANAINIFDPSIVMISGEFSRIPNEKFESFKGMIKEHMMIGSETEIFQSILNDDAAALGAALLMKDRIYYEIFNL